MRQGKLCFIGAGFHSSTNIYPSAIEAGVDIRAIATRSKENSERALIRFGSKGTPYDNYMDMIANEECDGVVIVAQPKDQFNIAMECIKKGKNVFVDKPLGWNKVEAEELAIEAKKHDSIAMVGFMKRYAPAYVRLKEAIDSEELGLVRSYDINFCVDGTPFCKTEEDFLKLAAIHIIDLIRYLFGEVVDITGFRNNIEANINNTISIKHNNGAVGSIHFSSMAPWSRESENVSVTFDKGFINVEEINRVVVHKNKANDGIPYASQTETDMVMTPSMTPMSGGLRDIYLRGFVGEIKHFVESILNRTQPSSNGEDNIKTMELCDNIIAALK